MSDRLHEMLGFVLENEVGLTPSKARSVASYFADIEEFLTAGENRFTNIQSITGKRAITLSADELRNIMDYRKSGLLSPDKSPTENYLEAMCRQFTKRQVDMLRNLKLDSMTPNPLLISALNLHGPEEIVRLNVYMTATRSIVTSMGFFVEKMLLASSESAEKPARGSGWDIMKTKPDGGRHWIQVKSGPNDMDKDQIVHWTAKIAEKISVGDGAYIGVTYGKRDLDTVTIGLMKQLLPNWEKNTLFGRELWDFISDDPGFHAVILETLKNAAIVILGSNSIYDELEYSANKITEEFIRRYGTGEKGVSNYIEHIF